MSIRNEILCDMYAINSEVEDALDAGSPSPYPYSNRMKDLGDCANWYIRNFRLWLDGSYDYRKTLMGQFHGSEVQGHFRAKCKDFIDNNNDKGLRSFVINQFTALVATDKDCSISYAQRAIVDGFDSTFNLDVFTKVLMDECRDFVSGSIWNQVADDAIEDSERRKFNIEADKLVEAKIAYHEELHALLKR